MAAAYSPQEIPLIISLKCVQKPPRVIIECSSSIRDVAFKICRTVLHVYKLDFGFHFER